MKLLKQPFFHFLLAGALIFVAYRVAGPQQAAIQSTDKVIDVDRASLLNFMQYRANVFQPELFNDRLDKMGEEERRALIDDYVREEALYREAIAMGLDQGDYNIRQRLVQKVEFLLENSVNDSLEPSDDEIRKFYEERKADYRVDAVYTFTHIFFDGEERGWEDAEKAAAALMADPATAGIGFNDAPQFGDRYPFLQNYVERTRDFVINNFTEDFVTRLDKLTPGDNHWHGPYKSRYGYHLVLLQKRTDPYIPALDDIRSRVTDDYRYETVLKNRKQAEEQVVADYQVNIDLQEPGE